MPKAAAPTPPMRPDETLAPPAPAQQAEAPKPAPDPTPAPPPSPVPPAATPAPPTPVETPPPARELAALPAVPRPPPAPPSEASLVAALGTVDCAALTPSASGSTIRLAGILPAGGESTAATSRLETRFPGFRVENVARTVARPFCGPLAALWRAHAIGSGAVPARIEIGKRRWVENEAFTFEVASSSTSLAFLQVSLVDAEGTVVHLLPTPRTTDASLAAGASRRIGSARGTPGGEVFEMAPPFGENLLLVLVADAPLFAQRRKQVETLAEFLPALEAALARTRASAAWTIVETVPQGAKVPPKR
jgi:hypothetical protein